MFRGGQCLARIYRFHLSSGVVGWLVVARYGLLAERQKAKRGKKLVQVEAEEGSAGRARFRAKRVNSRGKRERKERVGEHHEIFVNRKGRKIGRGKSI